MDLLIQKPMNKKGFYTNMQKGKKSLPVIESKKTANKTVKPNELPKQNTMLAKLNTILDTSPLPSTATSKPKGFTIPEGYLDPIYVENPRTNRGRSYITMPKDDPNFEPFYKLISGGTILSRAPKGLNQQGFKHNGTTARLKICNDIRRASGKLEQQAFLSEKDLCNLYVFRPEGITNKKKEQQKKFKS